MTLQHCLVVPGAVADELLHPLDVAIRWRQRHRLDRFALEVQQLPVEVGERPVALLSPAKERGEVRMLSDQFLR